MKFPQPLVLASQSPRRRELLNSLGLTFKIIAADVDESPIVGESPTEMVKRLATKKAEAVVSAVAPESVIIGADTIVVLKDGSILGKPTSKTDAVEMLKRLSGEENVVHTGFSLLRSNPAYHFVSCVTSSVEF